MDVNGKEEEPEPSTSQGKPGTLPDGALPNDNAVDNAAFDTKTGEAWVTGAGILGEHPDAQLPHAASLHVVHDAPHAMIGPQLPGPIGTPAQAADNSADPYQDVLTNGLEENPGVVGLHNTGNTCFLNAGLQCLFNNPAFARYFLEEFESGCTDEEKPEILRKLSGKFAILMEKAWSGKFQVISVISIKNYFAEEKNIFTGYGQQDSQEFLMQLLTNMIDELQVKQDDRSERSGSKEPSSPSSSQALAPALDDLIKENKVLNTNVSNEADEADVEMHVDSEKFQKQDNVTQQQQQQQQEQQQEQAEVEGAAVDMEEEELYAMPPSKAKSKGGEGSKDMSKNGKGDLPHADLAGGGDGAKGSPGDSAKGYSGDGANGYGAKEYPGDSAKGYPGDGANGDLGADKKFESENHFPKAGPSSFVVASTSVVNYNKHKPVKDTNLLVNHLTHKAPELYAKKFLFSELAGDADYSIRTIKRMKIDDEHSSPPSNHPQGAGGDDEGASASAALPPSMHAQPTAMQQQQQVDKFKRDCEAADKQFHLGSFIEKECYGQYKNEVKCSQCHSISIRFETFGQLQLAIPHAEEMNITVVFVSIDSPPTRYYLTLNNRGKVEDIIDKMRTIIQDEKADLRIAEVFDNHVSKNVSLMEELRNLTKNRTIYAFEMSPEPILEEEDEEEVESIQSAATPPVLDTDHDRSHANNNIPGPSCADAQVLNNNRQPTNGGEFCHNNNQVVPCGPPNNLVGNATTSTTTAATATTNNVAESVTPNNMLNIDVSCAWPANNLVSIDTLSPNKQQPTTPNNLQDVAGPNKMDDLSLSPIVKTAEVLASSQLGNVVNNLEEVANTITVRVSDIKKSSSSSSSSLPDLEVMRDGESMLNTSMETQVPYEEFYENSEVIHNQLGGLDTISTLTGGDGRNEASGMVTPPRAEKADNVTAGAAGSGVDRGETCCVCLEDMQASQLMVHKSGCSAKLCRTCVVMSEKHYSCPEGFVCPVCTKPVNAVTDFVQMDTLAGYKPKTRVQQVPVYQRHMILDDEGNILYKLFGHPNMLYLPSKISGEELYSMVDKVKPALPEDPNSKEEFPYTLVLTDGVGLSCSRCLFAAKCSGCPIDHDADVHLITAHDHLTLTYSPLTDEQIEFAEKCGDHMSMNQRKEKEEDIDLHSCFNYFKESEVITSYKCESCKTDTNATKTLSVWRLPNILMLQLKRFLMTAKNTSIKLDADVDFPLENFDVSEHIDGPKPDEALYDLASFICHHGQGLEGGHYTAFAKHSLTGEWWKFDDNTATKQEPEKVDRERAYIMFYQKKGTKAEMTLPISLRFTKPEDYHPRATSTPTTTTPDNGYDAAANPNHFSYNNNKGASILSAFDDNLVIAIPDDPDMLSVLPNDEMDTEE